MKTYKVEELVEAIRNVGVKKGDVVYVHSRLFSLGMMEGVKSKEDLCKKVTGAFTDVLGDEGTLVLPAFTTNVARSGGTFIVEETKCDTGILPEYLRLESASVRSCHPINSVVAVGKRAAEICLNVSTSNYGFNSPYHRMLEMGAKSINLGLMRYSNSWYHYLEGHFCVPYVYNKILDIPVYKDGRKVEKEFVGILRYLDYGVSYDLSAFDNALFKAGVIRNAKIGASEISSVDVKDYCDVGSRLLTDNVYSLLSRRPDFKQGQIPWDGIPEKK